MKLIKQKDIVKSVADALQFISYYHSLDFIQAIGRAYDLEKSPAAKDALAQILTNSRMCAEGQRPICQDTGAVIVFAKIGMNARIESIQSLNQMINEGVKQAYMHPNNKLRASMVYPPIGKRINTRDNTPAIIYHELVPGSNLEIALSAKGGGSENKAKLAILNPGDDIVEWVLETVPTMGAGWCPPGVLGLGIGGTAEKAMLMAKESLMQPVDMHVIQKKGPSNDLERLRLEIYKKVNSLGIGAQGLGGLTTVVDVKITQYSTHAASLPIALIPNCAATRHIKFSLDGSGPAKLVPPKIKDWPDVTWKASQQATRVDLEKISSAEIIKWKPGQRLLLNGKLLTGRDAAHKRIKEVIEKGDSLPANVDFHNRFIYYSGPVDPINGEAVGPAGPTTATRMDKFTEIMLSKTGILGMIGKAERGPEALESIKKHKAVYLMAVGGAAYLISKAISSAKILAYEELGMEAIYEFEVEDMPVTVAVDSNGTSVHETGPAEWAVKISEMTKN